MNTKKEEDIKKLVRLIDPTDKGIAWLKKLFMDITKAEQEEWDRLLEEIDFNIVASLYYPIYDKFFSNDEIKKLINFYSSPTGDKLAKTKSDDFSKQSFTKSELAEIDLFKNTDVGRKYDKLSNKISHKHSKLAMKYVDSLK
jgi:hypothetical protein